MRTWFVLALVALLSLSTPLVRAELVLNVTLDYDLDRNHVVNQGIINDMARELGARLGQPVRLVMTQNAERVGERIRTGAYDIVVAPAQLVGVAMRYGYTPVARSEKSTRVLLVGKRSAGMKSLEATRGKSIVLPHRDSLVSEVVRGEFVAKGLSLGRFYNRVTHVTSYGAALYALEVGQADVAAVKQEVFEEWAPRNPELTIVATLAEVPLAGVAVKNALDDALKQRIRLAFTDVSGKMQARLQQVRLHTLDPADTADFTYISERGHFTPEVLPGATIVTAEQVKSLMAQGVPLYDVRPQSHYRQGHIPGAINLTYEMNSPKEVDYDDALDRWDVSRLPKDKNQPVIFQCNGAECWYSYKAARMAIKLGYKKVYWFRTGLPAWRAAGYPIEQGA
ncbi:MAG: PhnD/SsuA/transferrin family substrate-binding protein [Thiobacillaceae bacterium]|nr:PhnD/SsuA/transferrin family substrate-binding protein [Thiobacillaceae bacterium]